MNTMAKTTCNFFDISALLGIKDPVITVSAKTPKKKSRYQKPYENGSKVSNRIVKPAKTTDEITRDQIVGLTNEDDINMIIAYFLERKAYTNAVLIIFGINTGFRCGDITSLRVQDCFVESDSGLTAREYITLKEQKTSYLESKPDRTVFLNDITRKSLTWLAENKGLDWNKNDFVFFADRPQNQFRWAENSELIAPIDVGSARKFIARAAKQLGIFGHYGSHTMRKTYAYFMGVENATIDKFHIDVARAQAALGHNDAKTTTKHYLNKSLKELRAKNLSFNLGYEAWNAYME